MRVRPKACTLAAVVALALAACRPALCGSADASVTPSAAARAALADTLRAKIVAAYDLSRGGDVVARLMSLYPDTGRIVSASAGHVTTTRAELERGIRAFWTYVGQNMRNPHWEWGPPALDVLSPNAAVLTMTYRVPHTTPAGEPHTIGGAWTSVWERRDGRWVIVQEHLSDAPVQ